MKKITIVTMFVLTLVSSLSPVQARRSLNPMWQQWTVQNLGPDLDRVVPSSTLGDRYVGEYHWSQSNGVRRVEFQLIDQKEAQVLASKTFEFAAVMGADEQKALLHDFMDFWQSIEGDLLFEGENNVNADNAFQRMIHKLVPSANASILALGAGMLIGIGFVAFIIGKGMRSVGGSDLMVGVDIVGGMIQLAGGAMFLVGVGTVVCEKFLR